jgi:hypothetical protein
VHSDRANVRPSRTAEGVARWLTVISRAERVASVLLYFLGDEFKALGITGFLAD